MSLMLLFFLIFELILNPIKPTDDVVKNGTKERLCKSERKIVK